MSSVLILDDQATGSEVYYFDEATVTRTVTSMYYCGQLHFIFINRNS